VRSGEDATGSSRGGGLTDVERVGETVHRSTSSWTQAVHALLAHLELVGFEGAPRVLGFDSEGREVLSFIAGTGLFAWTDHWKDTRRRGHSQIESQTKSTGATLTNSPRGDVRHTHSAGMSPDRLRRVCRGALVTVVAYPNRQA
jgi:hypothetical protein